MRKLVGAGQKSDFYWAFDRLTGEPLWFSSIGYGSKGGGIHAEAAVGDGTIYVWSNNRYLYPLNLQSKYNFEGELESRTKFKLIFRFSLTL